jgi:hypothetical protein
MKEVIGHLTRSRYLSVLTLPRSTRFSCKIFPNFPCSCIRALIILTRERRMEGSPSRSIGPCQLRNVLGTRRASEFTPIASFACRYTVFSPSERLLRVAKALTSQFVRNVRYLDLSLRRDCHSTCNSKLHRKLRERDEIRQFR